MRIEIIGKEIETIKEKQANTYIHIDEDYKNSKFHYDGWFK